MGVDIRRLAFSPGGCPIATSYLRPGDMDVEYYGPNPQMPGWYLSALRTAEEMALELGEDDFALLSVLCIFEQECAVENFTQ